MHAMLRTLVVPVLILCSGILQAAETFEGRASFDIREGKKRSGAMTYSVKGENVRIEAEMPGAEGAAMILRSKERRILMLMAEQQMYMEMPLQSPPGNAPSAPPAGEEPKVTRTGRSEQILGYTCEEIEVREADGSVTSVWVTGALGSFMTFSTNPMQGMPGAGEVREKAWERVLRDGEAWFPLRVTTQKDGRETFRMEATKVERATLDEAEFQPPAGWQKFNMPAGMPGMMGR